MRRAAQLAIMIEAQRRRVERRALRAMRPLLRDLRRSVLWEVHHRRDPTHRLRQHFAMITPFLTDLMVEAHVVAKRHAVKAAAKVSRTTRGLRLAFDPDDLRDRLGDGRPDGIDLLRKLYQPDAQAAVTRAEQAVAQRVIDAVNTAVRDSLHVAGTVARVNQALTSAGLDPLRPHVVETLARTQSAVAYSAGQRNANRDPAVDEILWGYEYVTVGDDRVRPTHRALEGYRAPKGDPIWKSIFPPNGFNCRCTAIEIYQDDRLADPTDFPPAVDTGGGMMAQPGPDEGWDFDPGDVFPDLLVGAI